MTANPYQRAHFVISAAKIKQLPEDSGLEVAFAGRSNAGKSSALNCITNNKQLARVSKTPGRTQQINVFQLSEENKRLIDLPGYGFAAVPPRIKKAWEEELGRYFHERRSLTGLVLVMDSRHPLKPLDEMMLEWVRYNQLACHVLLTKADKLSRHQAKQTLFSVQKYLTALEANTSIQLFSALKKEGIDEVRSLLDAWLQIPN